jgi:hypothetical protein
LGLDCSLAPRKRAASSHELSSSDYSVAEVAAQLQERPAGDVHPLSALFGLGKQEAWLRFRAKNLEHLDPEAIATIFDQARIKAMFEPHSSIKTRFPASSVRACSRQDARSSSLSSLARNVFFWRVLLFYF